jgi:hypothetical protein
LNSRSAPLGEQPGTVEDIAFEQPGTAQPGPVRFQRHFPVRPDQIGEPLRPGFAVARSSVENPNSSKDTSSTDSAESKWLACGQCFPWCPALAVTCTSGV